MLRPLSQDNIRVCHVAVADLWAGAEVQLKVLLSELVRQPGLKLSAILFNRGRLEKEIEKLDIPITVFPEQEWGNIRIFRSLRTKFASSDIQIVHTHKYKDTILAAPAAKIAGVPYVVRTVHGLSEPFRGIKAMRMRLYETCEQLVYRRYLDALIGVSSKIEEQYRDEPHIPKVLCIRNGIYLDKQMDQNDRTQIRKEFGIDSEICVIGTLGRLTPVKGLPFLLLAAKSLLDQKIMVRVLIVGDGSIRSDLEMQARDLAISENVVFCGHKENTGALISAMDIFVLPSLSEGIPMALLEAMAASRAIVASRVGGIPEVLEDGVEGFLVDPMDVQGLAEKCRLLIQSPGLIHAMGINARKRVEQHFSANKMAIQVTALYRQMVSID